MSERVKFDDDAAAKGKIATAPDITAGMKEGAKKLNEQVKEEVGNGSDTGCEPVKTVPDDPAIDARNTRLIVKTARSFKELDSDIEQAIGEFGENLWPLLRMAGMGWRTYTVLIGSMLVVPLVPSGFKIIKGMMKKKDKEEREQGNDE